MFSDFVLVYEKLDKQSEKASKAENRQKYVRAIQREGIDTEEVSCVLLIIFQLLCYWRNQPFVGKK